MQGNDRATGPGARHRHDLSAVRYPVLCQGGPNPGEADFDQSAVQCGEVQPGEWLAAGRLRGGQTRLDSHQRA